MTIPELRKAFERVDQFITSKVSKLSEKEGKAVFKKEWKRIFGKDVSDEAATEYLQFVKAHKSQKGGYAPLSYEMSPGSTPTVQALPYVQDGFGFANKDSFTLGGSKDYLLAVPDISPSGAVRNTTVSGGGRRKTRKGKKQGGGGGSVGAAFSEFMARPFGMNSPPSALQVLGNMATGSSSFASPLPEINKIQGQQLIIHSADINPITRKM
jgi:hypothetical protein